MKEAQRVGQVTTVRGLLSVSCTFKKRSCHRVERGLPVSEGYCELYRVWLTRKSVIVVRTAFVLSWNYCSG